ncbi:helix-turn-helix transcriptional regulator [Oscillibacter sp. PC13]|uniref:helix-turn-helix domain-containing protein n=1 Tax=Oscillibacter sp. PC13 TaxID=1855299 RepID=UPI00325B0EB0
MCTVEKRANTKRPLHNRKGGAFMPVKYKIDVLPALKEAGYNTTRLRKEKLLAESTIQQLRKGDLVSWANISRICSMLNCQPGDLLEYVQDDVVVNE